MHYTARPYKNLCHPRRTDRATRYVEIVLAASQLHVGTSCATNPQRIEVVELEHYG